MMERAGIVEEPQEQRPDMRLRPVLVPAEAGHDAVRGAFVFDLDHRALARAVGRVEAYEEAQARGQRLPGATSRWNAGKDLSWEPLRVERVAEVAYDHLQGDRFRHATTFKRWRPDKPPEACRYDQLEETAPFELSRIFAGRR